MKSAIIVSFATICLIGTVSAIREDTQSKTNKIEESDASASSNTTESAAASVAEKKKDDESSALSNPLNGSVIADQD